MVFCLLPYWHHFCRTLRRKLRYVYYVTEAVKMKERLQRLLHRQDLCPLFVGSRPTTLKLYRKYWLQLFLRHFLGNRFKRRIVDSTARTCEQCKRTLGGTKQSVIFWAYTELYSFCSPLCRDKWLKPDQFVCKST